MSTIYQIKLVDGSIRPMSSRWIKCGSEVTEYVSNFSDTVPQMKPCTILDNSDPNTIDVNAQYIIHDLQLNENLTISGYWIRTLSGGIVAYNSTYNVLKPQMKPCTIQQKKFNAIKFDTFGENNYSKHCDDVYHRSILNKFEENYSKHYDDVYHFFGIFDEMVDNSDPNTIDVNAQYIIHDLQLNENLTISGYWIRTLSSGIVEHNSTYDVLKPQMTQCVVIDRIEPNTCDVN